MMFGCGEDLNNNQQIWRVALQTQIIPMIKEVVIIGVLMLLGCSIGIPLNPMQTRCMMAYTDDNYETLKLDVMFPGLPEQGSHEVYQIQIENTETHQVLHQTIANGRYRKEMDLDQHAIYKFCFTLFTNRPHINAVVVDYNSDIEYHESQKTIKVPENLLKSEETKAAYEKIVGMEQALEQYQGFSKRKNEQQNLSYIQTVEVTNRLSMISYIEIAVVLIAGVYQFFKIRKFLVDRQYM